MNNSKELIEALVGEVKDLLAGRSVLGEPIAVGDVTVIPVTSYGFGFGGGAGSGTSSGKEEQGSGGGAGAGVGMKPVALVVIDQNGVRVERLKGVTGSLVESVSGAVERIMEKRNSSPEDSKE